MPEAVGLEGLRPSLALFHRALAGSAVALAAYARDEDPAQYPDTRGTIRLPGRATAEWYRVALAHRATHADGGTFAFAIDRASPRFARLRPALPPAPGERDLGRFLRTFADPALAGDAFTLLEDARIDALLAATYAGLRDALGRARQAELARRPALGSLAPRAVLLELAARASLGWSGEARVPGPLVAPAQAGVALVYALADQRATVEDAAEAAIRLYAIISRLPQLIAAPPERAAFGPGPLPADPEISLPEAERARIEGDAILAVPLAPIAYRGSLEALIADRRSPGPLEAEAILRLRALDGEAVGEGSAASVPLRDGGADATGPSGPVPHEHHDYGDEEAAAHTAGALWPDGPRSFVYPEWDHRLRAYRPRWCRVREVVAEGGATARAYRAALAAHAPLVREIRRQFERVAPETRRRVRGLRDGDELDLDAALEALGDLRAGVLPSEKVYAARELAQRDLAAAFLIDLSASTAERIEEPPGRPARRILDVERDSLVLLVEALERVGDVYGLYGFSGTGRADVRFVVIKDLRERATDRVVRRFDLLRPIHATRMGAAIRHATRKLRAEEAATKLLVVISDGRPYDLDYGQAYGEGAEIDYAVADTRRALDEARSAGVRPFLLTVDRAGADYLREIARGIDYEVLVRVSDLPARLLALYRGLSAPARAFASGGGGSRKIE